MKNLFLLLNVLIITISYAQNEYFYNIGNSVGYIKDNKGNKYLVIEENSGAKLIKVNENPEELMKDKFGISKEDLKFGGDER
ncbi:hypothetical protein [Hydrogenivirga sp. 128-5-R1-1]|uniref:hypothetical protein n=1 Tax=Hydrogenivirga sp. 128-5-R1-1 TaxID=392423 RepID=UPI00015F2292|nr:hypothetical protein [Hydrogenivirga sp. 128-5-R1-1]EDP73759.1 hypothetical protein HG1285_10662 [Hydrogenivirga sp. 128-5-R1-1]